MLLCEHGFPGHWMNLVHESWFDSSDWEVEVQLFKQLFWSYHALPYHTISYHWIPWMYIQRIQTQRIAEQPIVLYICMFLIPYVFFFCIYISYLYSGLMYQCLYLFFITYTWMLMVTGFDLAMSLVLRYALTSHDAENCVRFPRYWLQICWLITRI